MDSIFKQRKRMHVGIPILGVVPANAGTHNHHSE
jgi:hypothetical protein